MILPIRFTSEELAQIDEIISNDNTLGLESRADYFRMLHAREVNRRKGLPAPSASQWSGVMRKRRYTARRITPQPQSYVVTQLEPLGGAK